MNSSSVRAGTTTQMLKAGFGRGSVTEDARIYFASARNNSWPEPINRFFGSTNRYEVPKWGFVFLGIGNGLLCYFSSLTSLITFTGVIIVTLYLLVAVSAIASRIRNRSDERPFRMSLWPLPPIIAILGVVVALTQQVPEDLVIAGVIILAALLYWGPT